MLTWTSSFSPYGETEDITLGVHEGETIMLRYQSGQRERADFTGSIFFSRDGRISMSGLRHTAPVGIRTMYRERPFRYMLFLSSTI